MNSKFLKNWTFYDKIICIFVERMKSNMKKILFAAHDLGLGGIETALVALINYLADVKQENGYKYEITLVLEKKQGIFLKNLNSRIKIIQNW